MTRVRCGAGTARLIATIGALLAGEGVLYLAGRRLPPLPLDAGRLARTFDEADPLAVAVSGLRVVALVVGAALLLITVAGIAARALGAARLVVHVDRWTPKSLRHVLDGAIGAGLAVSIGMSAVPAGADPAPPPSATTLRRIPDAPPPPAEPSASATTLRRLEDARPSAPGPGGPVTTLRRLPDAAPPPTLPATDAPGAAPAAATAPVTAPPAAPPVPSREGAQREVVVRPGDSFWRLAERYEADRLGRRPSEAEVGARWQEMVAINRHRLVVPDDADLLFPGQMLQLPAP